jgi:ABC-2 type transport system ATP-binding protein
MQPVLEVRSLSKSFGEILALDNLTFSLFPGEILGIVGPNGAGKTTLINCLLGLVEPTSGQILYFGLDFFRNRSWVLEKINFASNYVALPLSLTLEENLKVYACLYRVPSPRSRIEEVLRLFGLWERRSEPTRRLSSGQMMRLCLAKALLNHPRVLLLDEPTAGLDPEVAHKTRDLLRRLAKERGLSVLITSHNLYEMEEISDRVLVLQNGQRKALGQIEELLSAFGVQDLEDLYFKLLSNP